VLKWILLLCSYLDKKPQPWKAKLGRRENESQGGNATGTGHAILGWESWSWEVWIHPIFNILRILAGSGLQCPCLKTRELLEWSLWSLSIQRSCGLVKVIIQFTGVTWKQRPGHLFTQGLGMVTGRRKQVEWSVSSGVGALIYLLPQHLAPFREHPVNAYWMNE
jgi:hypothetical protein